MKRVTPLKWFLAAGCLLLASCAVITVNVYFPEKAAKEAYKSLDEMLLKQGAEKKTGPAEKMPAPQQRAPESKPQSRLLPEWLRFGLSEACAADTQAEAEQLAVELSSMPEVLKAYDEMNSRLPRLTELFDAGVVGMTNQGLVTIREKGKATAQDEAMIAAENKSRKVVVTSMAKAILKLDQQKESGKALNSVLGKAATTFADTRREAAKAGWWVQLENGRWVQK